MLKIDVYTKQITDELMRLLLTADPNEQAVRHYLTDSTVFVALMYGYVVGVAVLVVTDGDFELKNIAVHESHQEKGIAKSLIAAVKEKAKNLGAEALYVGTGNSGFSQLALYQKCGFRMQRIEKDFFADYPEKIYENGIQCLDLVMLKVDL